MIYSAMCYILWLLDGLSCSLITCFGFEQKKEHISKWKLILGLFLAQLPFIIIKFVFNWQPLLRSLGWIFVVLVSFAYSIFLFKGYIWQKLLFVVFRIICCCLADGFVQFLFQKTFLQLEEVRFNEPAVVVYIACTEMLFIILFLLFMLIWKKLLYEKGYDLKIFFIFIIFPISQIIMLSSINMRVLTEVTLQGTVAVLSLVIGIVADVLLLVLLLWQQNMYEMEVKLQQVEKAWEVEQNYYRDIESRREELAKIRHDISEQFIVMQELLHNENYEKVVEMLYTLKEYVASTKEYVYCGDPVVNAIMAENERECSKRGVYLTYNLEIMQPLKLNPVVICSIFSNLMRNALAGAEKVADKKKAKIVIKAAIKGDYLCVKVDNTFDPAAEKNKKNRKGYGLEILRTTVEKYHGQMDTVIENGKYITSISVENIE